MDFPIENCIVPDLHFSVTKVQELLQYPHLLTCVLLDLKLLEIEINKLGGEKAITCSLSREELGLLSTLTLAKRKREWLGGRFAAKYVTQRLLGQVEPQEYFMHWPGYAIIADKNGRPYLSVNNENIKHLPMPDISISHSGSIAAAMAIHKGYCGIDIQKVTPKVLKVKDRFCSRDERQILEVFFPVGSGNRATSLTKLWAAKETLRKASNMSSLPGFLELELIDIKALPLHKEIGPWGFIFNWKYPEGHMYKKCTVSVTQLGDYALALAARDDTVD